MLLVYMDCKQSCHITMYIIDNTSSNGVELYNCCHRNLFYSSVSCYDEALFHVFFHVHSMPYILKPKCTFIYLDI